MKYREVSMARSRTTGPGKKQTPKILKTSKQGKHKKSLKPAEAALQARHEIPQGYNIDTIVLMPVNRDTSFIYWEVTDRLLNGSREKLKSGSAELMIKVFEEGCLKEVCSFGVSDRIGNSYIHYQPSLKPFVAEIGVSNGNGYVGLLKSRTLSSPGPGRLPTGKKIPKPLSGPSEKGKELWMARKEDQREIICMPAGGGSVNKSRIMQYFREVGAFSDSSLFSKI